MRRERESGDERRAKEKIKEKKKNGKKSREIEKWKKNETIKGKLYNMRFASQVCAALLRRKGY